MVSRFFADYLTHRLVAKTRHGTHSPFVYKLTDEVIYDFSAKIIYDPIEQQRKKLLDDGSPLILKQNWECLGLPNFSRTTTKRLAKRLMNSPKVDQLLYRLVADRRPSTLLQIGTGFGISTAYFSSANANSSIKVIDCEPQISIIVQRVLGNLEINNVDLQTGDPQKLLANVLSSAPQPEIIYFDQFKDAPTLFHLFQLCLAKADEGSMFIIKGIYDDQLMKTVWTDIKRHPKVTITIDLFWVGLVFFKKDQAIEHFKIKYPL